MRVGVIGLGSMGMGAALNLLKAEGMQVAGVDPRPSAQAEFTADGGTGLGRAADQLAARTRVTRARRDEEG